MGDEEPSPAVWKGSTQACIAAPIDKVWGIVSDFCGISKWAPAALVVSSELIEGEAQKPGCLRRLITTTTLPDGTQGFADERLLQLDADNHTFKYVVEANFLHLEGLVGTLKLTCKNGTSTIVDWSYEKPASEAISEEAVATTMASLYEAFLKNLAGVVA